ncbi:MAG: DUF2935 domain-containing protein [Bacillota bacterium]|jgi:hypothetical protein|nr:DUF2935 domain-containing protein [Bacillota bacterium]NLM07843.1 DUF2935 domain-containing protein [Clostridiales Family XIII bacterium]
MLSNREFVRESLGLHLFFARIMKEHAFFMEIGFTPKDRNFTEAADAFRIAFDRILEEVIRLSDCSIGAEYLDSEEAITPYTLRAEEASIFYTGVRINTELTRMESELSADGQCREDNMKVQRVHDLNQRIIDLLSRFIDFKMRVLDDMLTCKMFTVNYPLLIDHIMREAILYRMLLQRLNENEEVDIEREAIEQEMFWNRIMAEHSLFIRGLLDPTENDLIVAANNFGNEFNALYERSREAMDLTMSISQLTQDSLDATMRISEFNAQGTQGILDCKVRSIIIPLLGDHVLRESNHFIRLLRKYSG